jgi:predicted outer membrane protein
MTEVEQVLADYRTRVLGVLTVGILAALVGIAVLPGTAHAAALDDGWTNTQWGPLGPADRDLLVKVRLAGLWEGPAGDMAQTHSDNATVKEVGHHLKEDHAALDEAVRGAAAKLGVPLPDQPNSDQQGWLGEMTNARGTNFDRIFADRLRAAHGKVFSVVAAVRAGTRNEVIRTLAQTGISVVMKHMTLLESIGLVNYEALPTAVPPAIVPAASATKSSGINPNLVWLVLGIALVAGLVTAARVVRPR